MNGILPLALAGNLYYVIGGRFDECPPTAVGVKMAKEIPLPCHIDIPTVDFQVPPKDALDAGLEQAVQAILQGQPVYVGCMGGRGRTGLFLAVLAKAFGVQNPVEYVRAEYYSHAVETVPQYNYVMNYEVPKRVKRAIFWAKLRQRLLFIRGKSLTNLGGVF